MWLALFGVILASSEFHLTFDLYAQCHPMMMTCLVMMMELPVRRGCSTLVYIFIGDVKKNFYQNA